MQQKKTSTLVLAGALLAGGLLLGTSAQAGPSAEMLSNTCAGCHGTNGVSAGPAMPTIAGLPAEHLKKVMGEFKNGKRPSTIMGRLMKGYTDEELATIATFFAKQKWANAQGAPQSKMATAVDGKLAAQGGKIQKNCAKCHDDDGRSQEDDVPRLAGQWLDYLLIKMEDYKDEGIKVPQPEKMEKQMGKKSLDELKALAHFYASQQ